MIGLFVENMAVMSDLYTQILGLSNPWDGESPYAEFNDHEGIRFAMYERRCLPELLGSTPDYPERLNGTFELAIVVGKSQC